MTSEEAIVILKKLWCYEKIDYDDEEIRDAIDVAIKSINKQIQKKPSARRHNICIVYRCPVCGKLLTTFYPGTNYFVCDRTEFCDDCGQRLDWSKYR